MGEMDIAQPPPLNKGEPESLSSGEGDQRFSFLRVSVFESLQFRDFRWLWLGSFASYMAMNMQMITRGWLVLRLADDSPFALSIVMMAFALPMTFMSPLGGALADRIPRKFMIMFSQGGTVLMTLLLATLDLADLIRFWHLLIIGMVNGSLMAFNMPSRQAIISDIVPVDKLMNAISLNSSGMNLTRIVGPALAGVLIIFISTAGVFYIIAGLFLCSVLSIAMIDTRGKKKDRVRKGLTSDIREGLSYVFSDSTISGLIITLFMPALFGFTYFALLPAWGREALDVQSDSLGLLMMVMGIGSLTGTLILASMGKFRRRGALLLVFAFAWGIGLAIFSQADSYRMAMPLLFIVGLLSAIFMSLNMTLIQVYSKETMRGRVMSISMMTFGAMPLSVVPFGALAERIGTPNALGISGMMLAAFTVVFSFVNGKFRNIP